MIDSEEARIDFDMFGWSRVEMILFFELILS